MCTKQKELAGWLLEPTSERKPAYNISKLTAPSKNYVSAFAAIFAHIMIYTIWYNIGLKVYISFGLLMLFKKELSR